MHDAVARRHPSRPRTAVILTGILLLAGLAMAAGLAHARGLGERVHIPGWQITFCPPGGWQDLGYQDSDYGETVHYRDGADPGTARQMTFERWPNPGNLPPADLCLIAANRVLDLRGLVRVPGWRQGLSAARMGPLRGVRLVVPAGAYFLVGLADPPAADGAVYVLTLLSPQQHLTPADAHLVESVAAAIQLADR